MKKILYILSWLLLGVTSVLYALDIKIIKDPQIRMVIGILMALSLVYVMIVYKRIKED